jgi:flagellar hook assembly protein FlgD
VAVSVHDVTGRRVRALAGRAFAAGPAALPWDGRDEAGRKVPAGVYFFRIEGADLAEAGRVVRVR